MIDKIKILGHEYTVEMNSEIQQDYEQSAQISHAKCVITIGSRLVDSRREECLMHEIVEALNYHLELRLEHEKITQLGEGLYQVLKDSGLLVIL